MKTLIFQGFFFFCVTFCESNAKALLSATPTKMQPASGFCALPGALPRLRRQIVSPFHLFISSMRKYISIKSATMQSLYILQPCNIHLCKIFIVCIVAFFLLFRLDIIQFPIPRTVYLLRPNAKLLFGIFQCPL